MYGPGGVGEEDMMLQLAGHKKRKAESSQEKQGDGLSSPRLSWTPAMMRIEEDHRVSLSLAAFAFAPGFDSTLEKRELRRNHRKDKRAAMLPPKAAPLCMLELGTSIEA